MANFIKLAIVGQSLGQEVVAVLYYAETSGDPDEALSPTVRTEFGEGFASAQLQDYVAGLSNQYEVTELQVSAVNEDNEVTSNYTVFVPDSTSGIRTGALDGVANVGVIGFQVSYPFLGAPVGLRVPKRSYLAYGPIQSGDIGDNGAMLWATAFTTPIQSALTSQVTVTGSTWMPIRIGVPNNLGVSAIGKIEGIIFRPYSSDRRSRRQRPNGR